VPDECLGQSGIVPLKQRVVEGFSYHMLIASENLSNVLIGSRGDLIVVNPQF